MKLPHISVKRPITTMMVFIAIFLFGAVALKILPRDVLPDIEFPTLTVITVYPGASAEVVEEQVTRRMETVLAATENLRTIQSSSKENVSFITMRFNWNVDINEASNSARDMIELVKRRLPRDVYQPVILKVNSAMIPVLSYAIQASDNYYELSDIIEEEIAAPLRKVEGVGTVVAIGAPRREIRVEVDPLKMQAYGLSVNQIATVLKSENITIPGGNINVGTRDFSVSVFGEIEDVSEIEEVVLKSFNQKPVRVRDVAEVKDDFEERNSYARSQSQRSVMFFVQKQTGTNTLQVADAVKAEMDHIRTLLPDDVEIIELIDSSDIVTRSIRNLFSTLWWAGLFVMIVVFVFLREWKSSLIIMLTMPISLIVAFIFMFMADYSINIFSLMSVVIAIGMVVDNAIVVLENVTRHVEEGSKPRQASVFGASEIGMAISASTLTTISVFVPMLFMGGIVGVLFKQLAVLTTVTLLASLITALSLTPMLSSRLLKPVKKGEEKHGRLYQLSERVFVAIENFYKSTLNWAVHHKKVVVALAVLFFGITIYMGTRIGTDYIPQFDSGDVIIEFEMEIGTSPLETERIARRIESIVREEIPELQAEFSIVGQTEDGALTTVGFQEGRNIGTMLVRMGRPEERDRSAKEAADVVRRRIEAEIPEIEQFTVTGGSLLSNALFGNVSPIEVNITGHDFDRLNNMALLIQRELQQMEGFINIENSIDPGKAEYQIRVDKQRASQLGLNSAMIALQVRQSIYGADAGEFDDGGDEYDIIVRYSPQHRNSPEDLNNIMISTLTGKQVPVREVATIVESRGPLEINREEQQRIVKVMADLNGISLGEGAARVQAMLDEIPHESGVSVELGGQISDQSESFDSLMLMFIAGILLVYMVMASQFESLKDPFIIIFAIPFSIIGVIWAFVVTGLTLSVVTFIGVIMLLGVVVNNGIVLVDYTNLLRKRGYSLVEAVLEGGRSRLRPVLMTSFTTILGMTPMALSTGMGSEMWSPLGITIIGGMLFSTVITLVLVPVIYTLFNRNA
ncbi:efflux RND transporter permease subunit [Alkalitalea saponilacus]|uniref:Hydrophobic/amphiphilic exporter-1, HAE1 family n=1 Tax=Alkalitalea saponilacus TaxID=889453 RepID=A0A1T5HC94_9BACT|nr:efflux RND transporter permease subunit [Alkalitalea saponilacus]ASB50755.1 acriflavine resistance protein B [Alkalitalea saponilacus]SKC18303.1 hydrophobic/amphiphilic exporter-1, HAE1 family [Alkalitalea saponilacus]